MKKKLLTPLLGITLVACNNDEISPIIDDIVNNEQQEEFRTESEVIGIATTALKEFYPVTSRSALDYSKINIVFLGNTESRSENITNPLYVVNFGNDSGYAIISANKEIEPLLAITESGSITDLNDIQNPGLELFVASAMKLDKDTTGLVPIPPLPDPGDDGPILATEVRTDTVFRSNKYLDPQIKVKWGQNYPEGLFCPNKYCGCNVTAAVQALSYFEYPETLNLTYPERTSDQISLNWYFMKTTILSTDYSKPNGPYDFQLASLCREIGHKINSDYSGQYVTTAFLSKLRSYMKSLLPTDRFNVSTMHINVPSTPSFSEKGLMLISAKESGKVIGHTWVIDGYSFKDYTVYVYFKYIDSPVEYLERQFDKYELFFHCNWGERGKDNGFFRYDLFKTSSFNYEENFQYFTIESK